MFRKFILLLCATIAIITIQGCVSDREDPEDTSNYPHEVYGRDSYTVECINGEVWILSDKHGKANIGIECKEEK